MVTIFWPIAEAVPGGADDVASAGRGRVSMRKASGRFASGTVAIFATLLFFLPASRAELSGRDIMVKVKAAREPGKDQTSEIAMELVSKRGDVTRREMIVYHKKYGDDGKTLLFFTSPADIEGTGLLVWSHTGSDDEEWLYLPDLGRVRRIGASSKGESFMGTDFSYEDMTDIDVDERTHERVGEEAVDGRQCYVVSSVPKEPGNYGKVVSWIDKENFLPVRVDFYDPELALLKQARFGDVRSVGGYPTAMRIEMKNVQTGHATRLEFESVRYDSGLDDDLFTERRLKRGR